MKKLTLLLLLVAMLVGTTAFAGVSPEADGDYFEDFKNLSVLQFYVTDAANSGEKTSFILGQTPYLYTSFDWASVANQGALTEYASWTNPSATITSFGFEIMNNAELAQDNAAHPGYVDFLIPMSGNEVGTWNVAAFWMQPFNSNPQAGFGSKSYTVMTPEPISSALFAIGGIGFLVRKKLFA